MLSIPVYCGPLLSENKFFIPPLPVGLLKYLLNVPVPVVPGVKPPNGLIPP